MIDIIHIMTQLPKTHDERENYHQLLIERNVSFTAVLSIMGVALFQTFQNIGVAQAGKYPFDKSLMIILIVMVATKIGSILYLKRKM